MPPKRKKPDRRATTEERGEGQVTPPLPPAAALSFLKETRGNPGWTAQDMAKSLNVSIAVARQVIPFLQAQGYIAKSDDGWLTTASGDAVAGSKPPRFTLQAVEAALSALAGRIEAANQDTGSRFQVTKAIAFGDFLSGLARVQAADVGAQLRPRGSAIGQAVTPVEMGAEREFLRRLKAKTPMLDIRRYEDWMGSRSHRKLP